MATIAGHDRPDEATTGKSSILCKYYMNGACSRGEACSFSHDLSIAPNTVCTHWLRGHCAFGDKCRYDHVRPEWAQTRSAGVASQGYEAPLGVPRPETDRLEDVLPISKLRISRQQGVDQRVDHGHIKEDASPVVTLPADPFGSEECKTTVTVLDSGVYGGAIDIHDELGAHKLQVEGTSGADSFHVAYAGSNTNTTTGGCSSDGNPHSSLSTSPHFNAWGLDGDGGWEDVDQGVQTWSGGVSLCYEYYQTGSCSNGHCRLAHGSWCEICENYALHPTDESEAQKHVVECKARHDRLLKRMQSAHVECCICLEKVLEKAGGDHKFGLLNCDHPFCLSCIRNWRSNVLGGADVDSALRTCPVCRITTHFITPSVTWPQTPEEKEEIIAGYKAKLASIPCRNFNYGQGTCPFGTSCMYRHEYADGRLEESDPRRVAADEGEVKFVEPVRLSDFLEIKQGKVRGRRR